MPTNHELSRTAQIRLGNGSVGVQFYQDLRLYKRTMDEQCQQQSYSGRREKGSRRRKEENKTRNWEETELDNE